jgi:hypothetical protein
MHDLISELLTPLAGTFDTGRMARGEPGLPAAFVWRGRTVHVAEEIAAWKHSTREGGVGELYLRRHYFKLRMGDGSMWTVYFVRQTPRSGDPRKRWFLYTIADPFSAPQEDPHDAS